MSMGACFAKLVTPLCSVKESGVAARRPPLVRSRTLPAIVVPGVTILHTQLDQATQDKRDTGGGTSPHKVAPAEPYFQPLLTVTAHDMGGGGRGSSTRSSWCESSASPSGSPGGLKVPGAAGIGRIARLLTKDMTRPGEGEPYRRRTHSLESKNSGLSDIRKASSIDSLVESGNNNNNVSSQVNNNSSSGLNNSRDHLNKSNGHLQAYLPATPIATKKNRKTPDTSSPGWTMDVLVDGLNLSKSDRKKLEKINKINIHLHALFAAVEHGQLEKARNIVENNTLDINSVNPDGLNVLEVAVMNNHVQLAKMLQQAGAAETNHGTVEARISHLQELVQRAERRRDELSALLVSAGPNQGKETERQRALWDRRCKILRKMKCGLDQLKPPPTPSSATVEVIDGTRVRVSFREPEAQHLAITTKFRVEWSVDEWSTQAGSLEITDLRRLSVIIDGLQQGQRHHFRVSSGNMKEYGPPLTTSPSSAIPSSWRDTDLQKPRLDGQITELDNLFNQVRNSRPEHAAEIKAIDPGQETPLNHRKTQKKKSIKQLFTPAPKFHKNLKRGSYLTCIVYCEDKVLVTTEDFPPVVEVDENYLSQPRSHFHWLLKVATTWEDVKSLRQDMEQAGSASNVPFRIKLLQAAANMQSALGIQDLGQFYHKPIKDSNGTLVFCTVRHVKSTKSISAMNVRWVTLPKLREKKISSTGSGSSDGSPDSAGDLLLSSLEDAIQYDQVSRVPLRRGLYLGYLKLQSSVDLLQVVVPENTPNMYPHVKIRENPHISREEWEWVQNLGGSISDSWQLSSDGEKSTDGDDENCGKPSPAQVVWHNQLAHAAQQLLHQLGVDDVAQHQHRLYSKEVIELSPECALLLIMPPVDAVCSAPGQEDALLSQPDLTLMPLQIFEMLHMGTYQKELMGRYARLSYILEMDTLMAQHASREAFSQAEVQYTRDRLWQLQSFQEALDQTWRGMRWVMDAISFARDKQTPGVPCQALLSCNLQTTQTSITITERCTEDSTSNHDTHSSSESLQNGADNKRLRKDDNLSFRTLKTDTPRMLKSNTAENIRTINKCDSRFQKSNTSECLIHKSGCQRCGKAYNSLNDCAVDSDEQNENVPLLSWTSDNKMEYSGERKMYNKDQEKSRSENHLQHCVEEMEYPPRKASAPSFFESSESTLKSKCCSSEPKISHKDSPSLESVEQNKRKKNSNTDSEYEESSSNVSHSKSPGSSCYDLHQRYNSTLSVEIQRAGSSLSHDSEASYSSMNASLRSLSSNETETDTLSLMSKESGRSEASESKSTEGEELVEGAIRSEEPAIIQVYAAYETGLASGTSVKLHVTPRTTAREVIDLVVKQLNMAVVLKGKGGPIYGNDKLKNFCLVAVIGARERCLRDDFRPLQLQNPWKRGRLYVRLKHDVLAAFEQSNSRHSAYL